ncbi:hypothetical protein [Nitrosovibrio sp. Nv6]|uniref:hypothetical protein n=1 Tax=Nitrosovibrio sp. Nv6 TaxID=1855340 RepID=UPI0008C6669D|nr:hypothetical protein [Nitrosovibrio sp. Nv6]SEO69019.1 hypothetical protein SAMN05216316_0807 [Nitrosovibrio sp. Nv6]
MTTKATLKTRFEAIDAHCESAARLELDRLFDPAYYDGAKFRAPSPQAAEAIWLKLIARKEHDFTQEIAQVLKTKSAVQSNILNKEIVSTLKAMVDAVFADERYLERMQDFYKEVARKALSQESSFVMDAKRLDLIDDTYRAGVKDALDRARRNIFAEFERDQSNEPKDTSFLSQWRHYSTLSPWQSIGTVVLLSLTSYLIAFIIASDTIQELLERFGWSSGTGL